MLHMTNFKHTHLSTRYDRPISTLKAVVQDYAKTASIITLTEVDSERRENALKMDGWGVITGDKTGRDDCGILWKQSDWEVIHKETVNVAQYMAGNIGAATVVLKHRVLRHTMVVSVIHLPSSVEGNGRISGGRRDEWLEARRRWLNRVKELMSKYNADSTIIVADWNLNLKAKWVQRLIKGFHPTWKLLWKAPFPVGGTFESRIIDFTLFKGKLTAVGEPNIHRSTDASDHKGYSETFGILS